MNIMVTKFVLNRGNRSIYSGDVVFSKWCPRSKFLDGRIEAEKHAWEMIKV